jgi:ABC-type transport system involved in cytochrome c biogenesis ATPase subunit
MCLSVLYLEGYECEVFESFGECQYAENPVLSSPAPTFASLFLLARMEHLPLTSLSLGQQPSCAAAPLLRSLQSPIL